MWSNYLNLFEFVSLAKRFLKLKISLNNPFQNYLLGENGCAACILFLLWSCSMPETVFYTLKHSTYPIVALWRLAWASLTLLPSTLS